MQGTTALEVARCSTSTARPSWLSSTAPNCHIALEIYVVPFINAKVVGSFRMARLNMFRRTSA